MYTSLDFAGIMVVIGLLTVLIALMLLIFIIILMGKVFKFAAKSGPAPSAQAPSAEPAAALALPSVGSAPSALQPTPQGEIEEETVAVISAAVAAVMDCAPYVISGIEPAAACAPYASAAIEAIRRQRKARPAWALAGMQDNIRPF